jgi:glycosyltransferase involved in cell wall biosynthesis
VKKHTILHTIETSGPGGAESILLDLASHLDAQRFRSIVLLPGRGWLYEQLQHAGVPTFLAKSKAWYDLCLLRAMAALARQEKVDLIHSHLGDQNFYSSIVGRLTGRKIVVTYHGSQGKSSGLKDRLKLGTVKRSASAAVVCSDYLRRQLQEAGFSSERIYRIHNGIETDRFAAPSRGILRAELGCSNGARLVGMVANVRESKGYEYFIRAARLVADSVPHVKFVAVGETNGFGYSNLLSLVSELDLGDRFCFLGFRGDVPEILADLDVFVLSSTSEGFSLATVEAMASGKAVVVTRSGGPEELVENGVTGFLVPREDPQSLATRICELLGNPSLAAAFGRSAKAAVQTKFSRAKMVGEYARLYESCLAPI